MSNLLLVVLALFLVALNGFFVAAEFGLVKLRATRIRGLAKRFGWPGRILARVHGQMDAYLSACQLGITLASLGLGWIGEPAFAAILEPLLSWLGVSSEKLVHSIAFFIAFSLISFLHIVVGELAPKSMAIRRTEAIALWAAPPLYFFYWTMYPAIWLLNKSAGAVLSLIGLGNAHHHEAHYSVEELKLILRGEHPSALLQRDEWSVMAHTLDFSELEVSDLMRPLHEMVAMSAGNTLADNLALIAQHRFSRYPYFDSDGHIAGVIHVKDIFLAQQQGQPLPDLAKLARQVTMVAASMQAMALFRRLREGLPHFAVVVNSDGKPYGFITLDNMLGALVGEIRDEFRQGRNDWLTMDDGTLVGKGSLPIFTLERALGIELEDEHADSVGGLVLEKLGALPKEGDKIAFGHFDVVVKKMHGPRILLLRVYPKVPHEDELAGG